MLRVRVEHTGYHKRVALVERQRDNGHERLIKDLGWAVTADPDDVPPVYRDHPAVVRFFAERDDGIHTVPDHEVDHARHDLKNALLAGHRGLVEDVVYDFTSRYGVPAFIERLLTPCLRDAGEEWVGGHLSVLDEHLMTSGLRDALRVVRGPTPPRRPAPPRSLDILLFDPPDEQHTLGVEVVDMRLADAGHRTLPIAGGVPLTDLVERARARSPDLVLASVTLTSSLGGALASAAALHRALPRVPVVLGGRGIDRVPAALPDGVHVVVNATSTDALLIADAVARREACPIYAA